MSLIDSKSILAKLMATENLTVEQRNVHTASFDVRNRVLTVPTLDDKISSELYDLFMGHEVGHALYTPLEGMIKVKESNIIMSIVNVVEDARIERKIKQRYPGLKNSFLKAYKQLNERDFFETRDKNLNYLNFIDRTNLHFKCGANLGIKFNEEERGLIDEIDSTETFDDVIDVSKKIIDYMKKEKEEIKKLNANSDDEESYRGDEYDLDYDENGQPIIDDFGDDEEETGDNSKEYFLDDKSEQPQVDYDIRSFTDDAYRKNESQLFADKGTSYEYVNIPKINLDKAIVDYKVIYKRYIDGGYRVNRNDFNEYRRESNKVVSYLTKEFEMRKNAEQMKRASTSKTGELDLNKIFSYNFNEDIFKKITVVPGGKSHGLIMFLDWSGSMTGHIGNTVKQLFNLVFFCKKVNIPFEVYSFIHDGDNEYSYIPNKKKGDLLVEQFFLANILSSRMTASELTTAGGALMHMSGIGSSHYVSTPIWLRMYSTPLHESIICAMEIVPEFQKKYKLQIVNTVFLTDGEGGILQQSIMENNYIKDFRFNKDGKKNTHIVLVDPVTKNQEKYVNHYNAAWDQMKCLINLLKKRTSSHVIGFYVTSSREFVQNINKFFGVRNSIEFDNIKTEFRKNKFMVANNTGFDDYYILRSNSMNTEEDAEFVVKENVTRRGLVSAFSKYTNARVNNRVILNRFIGLIS
jgi:hypothetical protein